MNTSNNDLLTMMGFVGGMIVMAFTVLDYLIKFHDRFKEGRESAPEKERPARSRREVEEPDAPPPSPKTKKPNWDLHPAFPYLPYRELLIIVSTGILLNYLGLMLSLRLHSILYLDMTGTALAAFLLGPWWGAITALLSSSAVNWLFYPGEGSEITIFPWVLVNMTGGLLWGYLAQGAGFRKYLRTAHTSSLAHLRFLASFGIVGAAATSIPGAWLEITLAQHQSLVLDQDIRGIFERLITQWQSGVESYLDPLMGPSGASVIVNTSLTVIEHFFRYIPDKTVSVSIALIVVKYGFPLFEQELIHGGPDKERVRDNHTSPLILGALYVPVFLIFMTQEIYDFPHSWMLWSTPWVASLAGYAMLKSFGPSDNTVYEAALARSTRYGRALKPVEREPAYNFCRHLTFAMLVASSTFIVCLPLVLRNFSDVALNFLCVVYGFLLAAHIIHVAIAQNISIARSDG